VHWFRGGLVFKAQRRVHHSTLGLRVIKKKKKKKKKKKFSEGPLASGKERTKMGLKPFALKMAQAKARIWP